MTALDKTKWFLPLFSASLGAACFVAFWLGDDPGSAWFALALMSGLGLLLLLGGRSETIRGVRGDGRDEYWQRIDVHATALARNVLIGAVIVMCAMRRGTARLLRDHAEPSSGFPGDRRAAAGTRDSWGRSAEGTAGAAAGP